MDAVVVIATVGNTAGKIIVAIISTAAVLAGSEAFVLSVELSGASFSTGVSESAVSVAGSFVAMAWPINSSKFCVAASVFELEANSAGSDEIGNADAAAAGRSRVFINKISRSFSVRAAACDGVFP